MKGHLAWTHRGARAGGRRRAGECALCVHTGTWGEKRHHCCNLSGFVSLNVWLRFSCELMGSYHFFAKYVWLTIGWNICKAFMYLVFFAYLFNIVEVCTVLYCLYLMWKLWNTGFNRDGSQSTDLLQFELLPTSNVALCSWAAQPSLQDIFPDWMLT